MDEQDFGELPEVARVEMLKDAFLTSYEPIKSGVGLLPEQFYDHIRRGVEYFSAADRRPETGGVHHPSLERYTQLRDGDNFAKAQYCLVESADAARWATKKSPELQRENLLLSIGWNATAANMLRAQLRQVEGPPPPYSSTSQT